MKIYSRNFLDEEFTEMMKCEMWGCVKSGLMLLVCDVLCPPPSNLVNQRPGLQRNKPCKQTCGNHVQGPYHDVTWATTFRIVHDQVYINIPGFFASCRPFCRPTDSFQVNIAFQSVKAPALESLVWWIWCTDHIDPLILTSYRNSPVGPQYRPLLTKAKSNNLTTCQGKWIWLKTNKNNG